MSYNRRHFLKTGSMVASSIALGSYAANAMSTMGERFFETNGAIKKFGLQLYTLRDDLPKDPKGILKQVASFGYSQIEGYEGGQGIFWGMKNTEFKKYLDGLGLDYVSTHCDINKNFEQKAAEAAEIGMKYLICPHLGAQKTLDDYKKWADEFNKRGEICKKNGIRFAYHNHDYSFTAKDGVMPQDIFMKNTDASLVDFEMDIYWVVTAGGDPIAWMQKYPKRFKLCHIKDRTKGATESAASCDLGTGSIDFKKILNAASKQGMQYYIVEQERYDNTTPLKSAQADAVYMKNFSF